MLHPFQQLRPEYEHLLSIMKVTRAADATFVYLSSASTSAAFTVLVEP